VKEINIFLENKGLDRTKMSDRFRQEAKATDGIMQDHEDRRDYTGHTLVYKTKKRDGISGDQQDRRNWVG
jgi:hypothetical protein